MSDRFRITLSPSLSERVDSERVGRVMAMLDKPGFWRRQQELMVIERFESDKPKLGLTWWGVEI